MIEFSSIGGPNRNPPNCTILDNRVFEKLVLADNHFQMLYEFLKFVYLLIMIYVDNHFHH